MAERSLKWCKTLGKGEIALYEQVLLFPQCFKKTCNADTYKQGLVWERVKIRSIQKTTLLRRKCWMAIHVHVFISPHNA